MKIHKFIYIVYIALIFSLIPASYGYASKLDQMHISLIRGDVQIKTDDTADWVAASINMPLREGDRLWVPEAGRLEINLQDGTYVRLDENSGIELLTVEKDAYQFYLSFGHTYINFRGLRNTFFQMDTPLSTVRVYDRSKFKINVSDTGFTELSVISGAVYAESRSGQTRVSSGKTLSIGEDQYAELSSLGASDEWEQWNRERDNNYYEQIYSRQYLPTELRSYSYDFDYYGSWVNTTSYGYVWTPTFSLSVGWSPYSYGRWSWIGSDYVWISYQPWGWVPFHYGRWIWNLSFGWCWVPPRYGSVYWGPGYVGWYYTPRYVSWVPLGPRDIYYGYGSYGPHSINMFKHKHHGKPIFYHHGHRRNAVTSVSRDSFLRGEYSRVALKENPFRKGVLTAGRPQITPEHATTRFLKKDIPSHKRPPQMVRNLNAKELKNSRPFVTSRNKSVMKPQTGLKPMTVRTVKKPLALFASKGPVKESYIQKRGQISGKQKGLIGSTQDKHRTSTSSILKSKEKHNTTNTATQRYSKTHRNVMTEKTLERYKKQPYSKQQKSDTSITKHYMKTKDPVVKKHSGKTTNLNRTQTTLRKTKRTVSPRQYTSTSRVKNISIKKNNNNTRVVKKGSSGSYRSAKSTPQKTYVFRGTNSSRNTQYSRKNVNRGLTSSRWRSGPGPSSRSHIGISRGLTGARPNNIRRR